MADDLVKLVESEQVGVCFDCDEERPIYAVQTVYGSKEGKMLVPTCRECYEQHHAA